MSNDKAGSVRAHGRSARQRGAGCGDCALLPRSLTPSLAGKTRAGFDDEWGKQGQARQTASRRPGLRRWLPSRRFRSVEVGQTIGRDDTARPRGGWVVSVVCLGLATTPHQTPPARVPRYISPRAHTSPILLLSHRGPTTFAPDSSSRVGWQDFGRLSISARSLTRTESARKVDYKGGANSG